MENFFTEDRRWPTGYTSWQTYLVPDLDTNVELRDMIGRYYRVLQEFPGVVPSPPHATVQPIHDEQPAAQIGQTDRDAYITAIGARAATIPAFEILAGPALAGSSGVVLDLYPDDPFQLLLDGMQSAISSVGGPEAIAFDTRPAHLTIAYAIEYQDSGIITSRLRRSRPSHAPLTVGAVDLVEVRQDADRGQYLWDLVQRFPLGAALTVL